MSDVLDNIATQMSQMVVKKAIIEPFIDWGLGELNLSASAQSFKSPANQIISANNAVNNAQVSSQSQNKSSLSGGSSGQSAANVDLKVINNSGVPIQTRKETQFDGTRTIVKLFMEGYARNVEGVRDVIKR